MERKNPISLKFDNLEQNQIDIMNMIISNQHILRYMKYLSNNPLAETIEDKDGNIIEQPEIYSDDPIIKNIILRPFDNTDITDTEVVRLFFNEYNGDLSDLALNKNIYILDIIIPLRCWVLQGLGQKRNIRIADEFTKMVDNQYITGIGKIFVIAYKTYKVNDSYGCFSLSVKIENSSLDSEYPEEEE